MSDLDASNGNHGEPASRARHGRARQDAAHSRPELDQGAGKAKRWRTGPKTAAASLVTVTAALTIAYAQAGGRNDGGQLSATEPDIRSPMADAEMLEQGELLYAANCASCHGAELEGQPDWKRRLPSGRMPAPPHDETGHTWHHADEQLFQITKEGVGSVIGGDYESDMPAFGGILSDPEIRAILAYIKSTWPEQQREYQAEITGNAEGATK